MKLDFRRRVASCLAANLFKKEAHLKERRNHSFCVYAFEFEPTDRYLAFTIVTYGAKLPETSTTKLVDVRA